ncbi:hypothetical protein OHA04_45475 (plasmid) [Streptomyces sp. NBC_01590]|uniref:hypothetical protein n=1 Tax=Streptomyces sp. NBC_01590 TaxID=2975887 RepID=UPI002F909BCA
MTQRISLANFTNDQLDALYERLEAAEETELARQLTTCDEAFASATFRAAKAESRVAELEAERQKSDAINAEVDAKTEQQLNDATEVVQYFKALAERTQVWGEQHRDRANRYRARADAVKAEFHALNSETKGLNPFAMAGRRDAVARMKAALATIAHDTPVPDDPRVAELQATVERVRAAVGALETQAAAFTTHHNPACECSWGEALDQAATRIRAALDQPQRPTMEADK